MSNCPETYPVNSCLGAKNSYKDLRLNQKQLKQSASGYTQEKVAFTVINNGADTAQNQNTPTSQKCVSNVGGPGDNISSLLTFNKKILENSVGVDRKHGSYDRYLARKKGWNFIKQNCS